MRVKRVYSVSLGSAQRDFSTTLDLWGERLMLRRLGTDGSYQLAAKLVQALDGEAAAIGLGGLNLYLATDRRRYPFSQAQALARLARQTPVVDGYLVKALWEPGAVRFLEEELHYPLKGRRVLLSSFLDRPFLGMALQETGARLCLGDAALALGLPLAFHSPATLRTAAAVTLPLLRHLPISLLYPTGTRQEEIGAGRSKLLRQAEVLAGDFHFLRRHLPQDLTGKVFLTSTVTPHDRQLLAQRGAGLLVGLTPAIGQRLVGANVLEALLAAHLDLGPGEEAPEAYQQVLRQWSPQPGYWYLSRGPEPQPTKD